MGQNEIPQAEQDDVRGAAVALLRAAELGDEEAGTAILATVEHEALIGYLLGLCWRLGPAAVGGPERFGEMLAEWQPGQRIGDGL